MMDNSGAPRARLITAFGTVLYVDVVSGHLRHGPVESSPANAVFVADPGWRQPHRKGRLMQDKGDSLEPIVCLADSCQTVSSMESGRDSAVGTPLELVPLERGLIAFAAEGLFLMADRALVYRRSPRRAAPGNREREVRLEKDSNPHCSSFDQKEGEREIHGHEGADLWLSAVVPWTCLL